MTVDAGHHIRQNAIWRFALKATFKENATVFSINTAYLEQQE